MIAFAAETFSSSVCGQTPVGDFYWWGFADYTARYQKNETTGVDRRQQFVNLRFDGSGYLWQPWIAQFLTGIGVGLRTNNLNSDREQNTNIGNDVSQDNQIYNANGRLTFLPRSIVPLTVFIERNDSRSSGDIVGRDYIRTMYGAQQIVTPEWGGNYFLEYRYTDWDEEESGDLFQQSIPDYTEEQWRFRFRETFGSHFLQYESRYDQEANNEGEKDTDLIHALRYRFIGPTLNVNNLVSYIDDETVAKNFENQRKLLQFSNSLYWSPETENRLTLSGATLISDSQNDMGSGSSRFITSNFGLAYEQTPNFSWTSTAFGTIAENRTGRDSNDEIADRDDRAGRGESDENFEWRAGFRYSSDPIQLSLADYRWNSRAEAGRRRDSELGDGSVALVSLGQSLEHNWQRWSGQIYASFNQSGSMLEDSVEEQEINLNHNLNLSWSRASSGNSTVARLSLSDTRRRADLDSDTQLVNVQLSRRTRVSRLAGWSGNLTVQGFRQNIGFSEGKWRVTTTADLNYQHNRAFGVRNLRYLSELRVVSDELSEDPDDGRFNNGIDNRSYWSNRLMYTIGRLDLEWRGDVVRYQSDMTYTVLFLVRRQIGGLR